MGSTLFAKEPVSGPKGINDIIKLQRLKHGCLVYPTTVKPQLFEVPGTAGILSNNR